MARWIGNKLVSWNRFSGDPRWWIIWTTGLALILVWGAITLPWFDLLTGAHLGVGVIVDHGHYLTFKAYGYEISSYWADRYILFVLLSVFIALTGEKLATVGWYFARGYTFEFVKAFGVIDGRWMKNDSTVDEYLL